MRMFHLTVALVENSQRTMDEVVNRGLRKRRPDGKTHRNIGQKALIDHLLLKPFGRKRQ